MDFGYVSDTAVGLQDWLGEEDRPLGLTIES